MTVSDWVRHGHRRQSIAFTAGVVVNVVAIFGMGGSKELAFWVCVLALFPLFLLLHSGLWLFALPYVAKPRSARSSDEET